MPTFDYKAIDEKGNTVSDTVSSSSRSNAIDELFSRGLNPSHVVEQMILQKKPQRFSGRLYRKDIEHFTRELGNLLAAGLSLSRALKILSRESTKPAAKQLWQDVHDNVANGMSLADSMRQWPKYFSKIYVAMVQAGETGGFLELVLEQIANFRSREQDLKNRVQSALIYPAILTVLAICILIFLMVYFIPRFSSIFAEFGGTLPSLTKWIVAASGFVLKYWLFIIGVVVLLGLMIKTYLERQEGRAAFERWILEVPVLGRLSARFAFVRFARMLGTLMNAGVPLLTALQVAREAIGNRTLAEAMNDSIEKVRKGVPLSQGLRNCPKLFSGANIEMIAVAEESARLGEELNRLAEVNETELDRNLKSAVSFLEPAMLFLMAVFVGTIVIGMLLPIFNLQDLMSQ